ncbi:hypothetical protein [Azospirillum argentinense]
MIIQSTRVSTSSGSGAIGHHVFGKTDENELIAPVMGAREDLDEMMELAAEHGAKYGLRHFTINPDKELTPEQWMQAIEAIDREFDPEGRRPGVLVLHVKERADGSKVQHGHYIKAELDPLTHRVMDSSHNMPRQEKIGRLLEFEFGHHLTLGRHNLAVAHALEKDGRNAASEAVMKLAALPLPESAFTSDHLRRAQRKDMDLPKMREAVAQAWARSDGADAFRNALAEKGLTVAKGEKQWVINDAEGSFVGAVHRFAGVKSKDVAARLEAPSQTPTPTPPKDKELQEVRPQSEQPQRTHSPKKEDANVREEATAERQTVAGSHAEREAGPAEPHPRQHVLDREIRVRGQGDDRGDVQDGPRPRHRRTDPAAAGDRRREAGGDGRKAERFDAANARRRIEADQLEAGFRQAGAIRRVEDLLGRVQALAKEPVPKAAEPKAAQPKASAKGSRTPSVRVGNNPTGGGGGKSGRSMEAALHAGTGWIEAPEMDGGGDGTPIHEPDQDELNEVSELTERWFDRLLRKLGLKGERPTAAEVRTSERPEPAETLEPAKAKTPKQPSEPEQAEPRQASAPEPAARPRAVVVPVRAKAPDLGRMAVSYAGMLRGSGYPGLDDSIRQRVDALPPHERESLSRTGRHYPGMHALEEIEARVQRAAEHDRINAPDLGAKSGVGYRMR